MTFFTFPERDYIYKLIESYYDNPKMKKIKELNGQSMYICKLDCLLNEKRYLIALTLRYENEPIGLETNLSNLRWKTFMARVLNDESFYQAPLQSYTPKRDDKYTILLYIKSRNKEISTYETQNQPIIVSLLHTQNYEYQYPDQGNLVSALETCQTIINWV
jgi:hypothetical protein